MTFFFLFLIHFSAFEERRVCSNCFLPPSIPNLSRVKLTQANGKEKGYYIASNIFSFINMKLRHSRNYPLYRMTGKNQIKSINEGAIKQLC